MNIDKVNLSKTYARIPYKEFKKCMQNIGFTEGNYDKAYLSIGGKIPKPKSKGD